MQPWKSLCDSCWSRLPGGHRGQIIAAREKKAPHLIASAIQAAAEWLKANTPAAVAARRMGGR